MKAERDVRGCDGGSRDQRQWGWGVAGRERERERQIRRVCASGLEDGGRGHEPHYRWTVEIGKVREQILL